MISQVILALCFATVIAAASHGTRLLTRGGAIAQFAMGFVLLGIGGWEWTVPTLVFFLTSSSLSSIAARRVPRTQELSAKGSTRDAMQVLANGGVVSVAAIGNRIVPDPIWYIVGVGSLAAANADTWGTELGALSRSKTRLITTFAVVEPGQSGGISVPGTLGGAVGACVVAISALPWFPAGRWGMILVLAGSGIAGSLMDSVLGASVQVQYSCARCGKATERSEHCGSASARIRGYEWIGNDSVNLACTITGGLCAGISTTIFL